MGKKGGKKAPSAYRARDAAPAQAFNVKASRINRLETAEDAFGSDGEDEFHKNRDMISLDQDTNGRDDLGDISDDDEIYALNLPSEDSEAEVDEEEYEEEDELEEEEGSEDEYSTLPIAKPDPTGRFAKVANPSQDIISDAEDSASDGGKDGSDSDEEETWAANSYHASRRAPGEPDSSDDEALDMEADEARRLQKKARGVMAGDDFGLGDGGEEGMEEIRQEERKRGKLEEEIEVVSGEGESKKWKSEEEAIAFVLRKNPETLALLDDFTDSAEKLKGVEKNLEIVRQGEGGKEHPALAIMELEHQALSTYLPTLAFYFSLLLTASPAPDLVEKVLLRLSSLRSALATMEELDLTSAQIEDSDEEEDEEMEGEESMLASDLWDLGEEALEGNSDDSEEEDEDDSVEDNEEDDSLMGEYDSEDGEEITDSMLGGLTDEELEELMADMAGDADADMLIAKVKSVQRAKKGLPPLEEEEDEYEQEILPAKKSKSKKEKKGPIDVLNLIPILPPSTSRPKASLPSSSKLSKAAKNNDYLEPTSLSLTDQNDKASKRHTLRFHVSQVHQKSLKRESGGKERVGGDEDLPRRSKEASRREVLKRQEHGGSKGEKLDGEDWNESDTKAAKGVRDSNPGGRTLEEVDDEGMDYYDLVKSGRDEGRVAKKAKYEGERRDEKAALDSLGDESALGPRGATAKMLKNKGLIPKRAKINRNSRVKKRVQYEKAKKKVASMKSIYTGGQANLGHGEYAGEKSGIVKKVVKSVRLAGGM